MDYLLNSFVSTERTRARIPFLIVELTRALFGVVFYKFNLEHWYFVSNIALLFLHYTLDIFIAKDTANKALFFKNSFTNSIFFKYIISFTISFITAESIVEYIDIIFKNNNFNFTKNENYNKIILRLIVYLIMTPLIFYYLKFKWALSGQETPIITMVVMSWLSLLILMYLIFKSVHSLKSKCK